MNGYKIEINDILGSNKITINTPIIILRNIPKRYLVPYDRKSPILDDRIHRDIYYVDTVKLQDDLTHRIQFIERFIPVGQVDLHDGAKTYTMIMANTRIIPVTNNYEEIKKNVWIATIRKNEKISKSLGTIYSESKPKVMIPVFPASYMKKSDMNQDEIINSKNNELYAYSDIYSDNSHGRWMINKYKFNIDKSHLKMIDSTGEISDMYIPLATLSPVTPGNILDDNELDSDKKFNRKVYFTTQGDISSDPNCIPPRDNMSGMTINQCNGIDDDQLFATFTSSDDMNNLSSKQGTKSSRTKKSNITQTQSESQSPAQIQGNRLILKEKDEPWFTKQSIVGDAASNSRPYKITGESSSLANNQTVFDDSVYGNIKETQQPFVSDCVIDEPVIGYSRSQLDRKCRGIENFDSEEYDDKDQHMEYFNNSVMYIICIIIIMLLIYRKG
jgi:hypothetical protein